MSKTSIHRINEFSLVSISDSEKVDTFYGIKDELGLDNYHYLESDSSFFHNIVWTSGTFKHRLNKTYLSENLFTPNEGNNKDYLRYNNLSVRLKQGYSWDNIFGLHLIVKTSMSNQILVSQICTVNDFKIADNNLLLEGVYWLEEVNFKIPDINEILLCQITEITYNDIIDNNDNGDIGFIYNFPVTFEPLIDEKPMPDYIKTNVSFDNNHFLMIKLSTSENKSIEQSILDYFGLSLANIEINHIIYFGNETLGFESLRISNELDKFLPVNIGLNLSRFLSNVELDIDIFVTTEIKIDNKLMKREAHINTNLSAINTLIESKIIHPETNFPVEVVKQNIVNNTIIDAKETVKIVPIYQPLFVEFISDDLVIENKAVYFDNLTKPGYLRIFNLDSKNKQINEQIILSKTTIDNKIYFDLSDFEPIIENGFYEIINVNSNMIIGKGKTLKK